MRPKRFSVIIGFVLLFSLLAPQAAHATTYNEKFSVWLINKYDRTPRGIPYLRINETLSLTARSHSYAMARAGKIFHSNLSVVGRQIPGWRIIGENVGIGPNLRTLNDAFMRSSGHRANLLCKCFRYIGVGVVYSRGIFYVTHIFYG